MPAQDIRYSILERVYEQCKHLLVPEFVGDPIDYSQHNPKRIAPSQFLSDAEIDALSPAELTAKYPGMDAAAAKAKRTADFTARETEIATTLLPMDADNRILRYIRAGYEDTANLKKIDGLPALMLEVGSGEFSLQRQNVGGDLPPRADAPITTLNAEAKRVVMTLRLVLTELQPTELYKTDGLEVDLAKSRPGRVFAIWNQLRQVLDRTYFTTQTQTLPQYAQRTTVIQTDISSGEVQESDVEDTVMDFRYEVVFTQEIMRN